MFAQDTSGFIGREMLEKLAFHHGATLTHLVTAAWMARLLAEEFGLATVECERIWHAALLHDIGKSEVRRAVLSKPGALSDDEFRQIKTHCLAGGEMLREIGAPLSLVQAAEEHHERWDGRGYPRGLVGCEISLVGRIVAVADGFSAMSEHRSYRPRLPLSRIMEIFNAGAGTQWDPAIVALLASPRVQRAIVDELGSDDEAEDLQGAAGR
ncbi:MAG TPA: HD domain-containing phosphohydrolase [Pantanalinema sp.]